MYAYPLSKETKSKLSSNAKTLLGIIYFIVCPAAEAVL